MERTIETNMQTSNSWWNEGKWTGKGWCVQLS